MLQIKSKTNTYAYAVHVQIEFLVVKIVIKLFFCVKRQTIHLQKFLVTSFFDDDLFNLLMLKQMKNIEYVQFVVCINCILFILLRYAL